MPTMRWGLEYGQPHTDYDNTCAGLETANIAHEKESYLLPLGVLIRAVV